MSRHWSYSSLATFEQCPRRWYHQYHDGIRGKPTPAMDRGTKVHDQLEWALRAPDLRQRKKLGWVDKTVNRYRKMKGVLPEVSLNLTRHWRPIEHLPGDRIPPGTYVTGRLDVVAPGFFADWKTGKIYPDKHADQMRLYAIMLVSATGIAKWDSELVYVDQEHIEPISFEFDSIKESQRSWDERAQKIYKAKKFPKKPSPLCAWCPANRINGGPCTA